jgi:hypothetical protein
MRALIVRAAIVAAICSTGAVRAADSASAAKPGPAKSLPNPTISASVTEWVVFVADAANPELNARNLFRDSLPQFVEDLRTSSASEKKGSSQPGPIGLVRFTADGAVEKDVAVDVQISYKNGRALGHWPRAKVRSSGLLWQDLKLDASGESHSLPEGSWLAGLRSGGVSVQSGSTREPFLLYDVELGYPVAMLVTAGKEGTYSVAHGMEAPLRDLTFYKREGEGHWRTATLASLTKAAGYSAPAAPAASAPATTTNVGAAAGGIIVAAPMVARAVRTINGKPAAADSAKAPTVTPAPGKNVKGTDATLGPPTETDATVLASWREKLATAGVSAADQEIVLKILARQALDEKRLTAIYRMDPAELDRILPLEVVPQPKKVSRIALVVVTGIDPAIGNELDQLVKKLSDPVWKNRETATKEIKKLGVRAKSRLEEAAKDKDTEVAYRAEQLLAALSRDPNQPNEEVTDALK